MSNQNQHNEALRFSDVGTLGQLERHPLFSASTFGVEIEMICWDADVAKNGRKENETQLRQELKDMNLTHEPEISRIVRRSGYKVAGEQAKGEAFGIGMDGFDTEHKMPVLEIRTGILQARPQGLEQFEAFLKSLSDHVRASKRKLRFEPNTGIHIHVSNPSIAEDTFSKLSAIVGVDEDKVWDDHEIFDRPFARFARMNNQQKYQADEPGVHKILADRLAYGANPKVLDDKQLKMALKTVLDQGTSGARYTAVNIHSEHPTVEYRYLSAAILSEQDGVEQIMKYIRYFISHATARSNKNQFTIHGNYNSATFTRLPNGMTRVDTHPLGTRSNVAQPGVKNRDIRIKLTGEKERPTGVPLDQWKKNDPRSFAAYVAKRMQPDNKEIV